MKTFASDIVANAYQQESQLIAQLYSSATDSDALPNFLQGLLRLLNSDKCTFVLIDTSGNVSSNMCLRLGFEPLYMEQFDQYYCQKSILSHLLQSVRASNEVVSAFVPQIIMPDEEYAKTEIYNDWSKKQDIRYGGILPLNLRGADISFVINRTLKQGNYHTEELAFLDHIAPHLTNILKIQRKFAALESEKQQLASGLYNLKRPYLLFDENLKVVFINREAELFFQCNHELTVTDGFFKARNPTLMSQINLTLSLAVSTALGQHNQTDRLVKIKRDGRQDIILQIFPVSMATDTIGMVESHRICAAMEIFDQDVIYKTSEQTLEALYSLTPAEARLATAMMAGHSLQEIEQATGTRINTLKTHLRAIFRKTDTSRQQELIAKLASLPRDAASS